MERENDRGSGFGPAVKMTFLVAASALGCAALGGLFGLLVAAVGGDAFGMPLRLAASVGMLIGLFVGAAVSCLACILVTVLKFSRPRKD